MKLITAVIKPFKVDEVRQAVADIGIQGVTSPRFTATELELVIPRFIEAPSTA